MADQEKKYSLIDLDTGDTEEESIVRTMRSVVDGEEIILVQSEQPTEATSTAAPQDLEPAAQAEVRAEAPLDLGEYDTEDHAVTTVAWSKPKPVSETETNEDDEVPFKRMQAVIIVCLITVIVAFVIYFNFFR